MRRAIPLQLKFVAIFLAAACAAPAWSVDDAAAQALLKKSECLTCHAVDKKKDGPSFKEVAAKLKGNADAEAIIVKHITSKPMIKIDGKEEQHPAIKSTKEDEIKNVAQWILSR